MTVECVLIGGGAFAIEVATYVEDVNRLAGDTGSPQIVISDVVSSAAPRRTVLDAILGTPPSYHTDLASVPALARKRAVIGIGDARVRWRIDKELAGLGLSFQTIVHPTAYIAETATLNAGCIVCPHVFVGPCAQIDRNVALNVGVMVGHDVVIERAAVLSPGSRMNGHSSCGVAAFLGSGAIMSPKARLGSFAMLSAGSVLSRAAGDGFLMHGNPAAGRQMFRVPDAI